MNRRLPAWVVFFYGLLASNAFAEDDMRALVKELVTQVKALKEQVAQSNARIDELEQKLQQTHHSQAQAQSVSPVAPSPTLAAAKDVQATEGKPLVTAGDVKDTIKFPGTDTSIGIGGFVKLDTLFSNVGMGENKFGNQRLEIAQIPVGPVPRGDDDQISLHAKESRFWFKSFTPTQWGNINTYLELDFYGDAGTTNYTPRLRHAYGSLGNLLAGQTWTTFLNSQAIADTLDNGNSVGSVLLLRQPLLRWTQPFSLAGLAMDWQLAAEAPRSRVWDAATQNMRSVSNSHYPDGVARLNFYPRWGNISLAALGRQLKFTPALTQTEQSVWGGAVSVAGKIDTFDADNLRFMLSYGNVLGRYAANDFFEDGVITAAGELEPLVSYSGLLAYQHWWDKSWRSTLALGFTRADQPGFAALANQEAQSIHANLLWNPIMQTTIGLEYIYANRELTNGQSGELQRVQFSTRFNF